MHRSGCGDALPARAVPPLHQRAAGLAGRIGRRAHSEAAAGCPAAHVGETLGMTSVVFAEGRHALEFGRSKINLHRVDQPFVPHAAHPEPGSADLCLIAATPIPQVIDHLRALQVPIIEGPVARTGARGNLTSVYLRDPDGNLIEISNYWAG